MNRLKWTILAVSMLLMVACSAHKPQLEQPGRAGGSSLAQAKETARLLPAVEVDSRIAQALLKQPQPPLRELPPLPLGEKPLKVPVALQEYWRNGAETYEKSDNASTGTVEVTLNAGLGEISWAIYQLPEFGSGRELRRVKIGASSPGFGGEYPGYWVAIANYDTDTWQILARTVETGAVFQYSIATTGPYRSPSENLYVALIVHDGQSVDIDRVGVDYEEAGWMMVEPDGTNDTGWSPAVEFAENGNPMIAYLDRTEHRPRFIVGDRLAGLDDPASWYRQSIGLPPPGVSGIDLVRDPNNALPRVSISFTEIDSGAANSIAGIGVMVDNGTNLVWEVRVAQSAVDGAGYTSIAPDPIIPDHYYTATYLANTLDTEEPADDMYFVEWNISNLDEVSLSSTRRFALEWDVHCYYPHLRTDPVSGSVAALVNGGVALLKEAEQPWIDILSQQHSSQLGSLAYNPGNNALAITYERHEDEMSQLVYIDDVTNPAAVPEVIAEVMPGFAGAWTGKSSQLVFFPDGTPAVAYTSYDGGGVYINYAYHDGSTWVAEQVTTEPSSMGVDDNSVLVDLAVLSDQDIAPTDMAVIAYNHISGTTSALRALIREF